jgi:subtilase family serine protease
MEQRMLLSGSGSTSTEPAIVNPSVKPIYLYKPTGSNTIETTPELTGSTTPVGVTPAEMRGAYGVGDISFNTSSGSVAGTGAGQTIAIIDAYDDPNAASDLHAFDQEFSLPDPPSFLKENDLGQTTNLPELDPAGAGNDDFEAEESLDIEWAHVIAPDANIILYEAASDTDLYNTARTAASNPAVTVVSMSFGIPDNGDASNDVTPVDLDNEVFTTPPDHQGITFVASAGDSGIYDPGTQTIDTVYPAESPNVVAVGGTTLDVTGDTYGSETAWGDGTNSGFEGGGGGGISLSETQPEYQKFLVTQSTTNRTYPDVAMDADPTTGVPIYDSYDDGTTTPWEAGQIGGTSLAAPMFAGLVAIANQGRSLDGLGSLNGASQTLPRLYQLPEADFHDISSGNNGYAASTGYDLTTGRGSPVGNLLVSDLSVSYIGFHVFNDVNLDGVQEQGEVGVQGTEVTLMSAGPDGIIGTSDDTMVQTTTTDAYGLFELDSPPAGTYYIHFQPTASYQISPEGTGTDPKENSVAAPVSGNTGPIVVTSTTQDPDVNLGIFQQSITIDNVTVTRPSSGVAPMVFTVTLAPANTNTIEVPYATSDGTATVANGDYLPTSGTLVFAAGVTSETITVDAVGNLKIEDNVSFNVNLTKPTGYPAGNSTGIGTILDSNFPVALVSGAPSLLRSSYDDVLFPFTIALSVPAPFTVTVPYTTADGTANGNVDYVSQSGTLTFAAGTTTAQTIDVVVIPGTNPELNKTFFLEAQASSTVSVGVSSTGTGTILSNAIPTVTASPATVTESLTGATQLVFDISLPAPLSGSVSVNYSTFDGSAIAGTDYTAESGTLTFTTGQIQKTVDVPVPQQFVAEQTKTLSLEVSNPTSGITVATPTVTGTIQYTPLAALDFSGRKQAVYTDSLNQTVTVSLKGLGYGQVIFSGTSSSQTNAFEIIASGTTTATSISVKVAGNGQTSFNEIISNGPLGSFSAKTANLLSSATFDSSLEGLSLGYLAAATINVGGAGSGQLLSLAFNRVLNSGITSAIPIASLTAGEYLATDGNPHYITAPSVGAVKVTGDFQGTIQTASITSVVVGGTLVNSDLRATNSIGTITAGAISGSTIFAGVNPDVTTLPNSAADFVNQKSKIGRVTIKSGQLADSIIAGWTVAAVTAPSVDAANGGTTFGITAAHVGSVKTKGSSLFSAIKIVDPKTSVVDDDFVVLPV